MLRRLPELGRRPRLADEHPGRRLRRLARERTAAFAGGNDVHADVAEGTQLLPVGDRDEAAETAPRDVLQEHALDGIPGAEPEDLVAPRLDDLRLQGANSRPPFSAGSRLANP